MYVKSTNGWKWNISLLWRRGYWNSEIKNNIKYKYIKTFMNKCIKPNIKLHTVVLDIYSVEFLYLMSTRLLGQRNLQTVDL